LLIINFCNKTFSICPLRFLQRGLQSPFYFSFIRFSRLARGVFYVFPDIIHKGFRAREAHFSNLEHNCERFRLFTHSGKNKLGKWRRRENKSWNFRASQFFYNFKNHARIHFTLLFPRRLNIPLVPKKKYALIS